MNEKHKLMKPKDPARIGRQATRRAKKWQSRLSAALLCALLFTVFFPSCKDEDLLPSAGMKADITRADGTLNDGGAGLVRNSDGTWTATRRVPLVGLGRVIDNISESLVEVGSYEEVETALQNLVDLDLTTTYSPTSVLDVDAALNQIVSIRDLNCVYAGGQKAGFALRRTDGGVLGLDVLQSLFIDTYLNGEATGEHIAYSSASNLIDVGLGNIAGGNAESMYVVEGDFEKPFDEIRLGQSGVNLSLLNGIEIAYAYVGENPMIPAVSEENEEENELSQKYFMNGVEALTGQVEGAPHGELWSTYIPYTLSSLTDGDLDNGVGIITGLSNITVDFKRTIPKGSEVGFYVTGWTAVGVGAGVTTKVRTYNGNTANDEKDSYSTSEILTIDAFGGGSTIFSLITSEECDRVRIDFDGFKLLDGILGGSYVHYAFVREPTEIDPTSYFSIADAVVATPNYRFADLDPAAPGTVEYVLRNAPANSEAKIEGNMLKNMNVVGEYIVEAIYKEEGKDPVTYTTKITRIAKPQKYCNNPIINTTGQDDWMAEPIDNFAGIEVISNQFDGDMDNLVNEDQTDYISTASSVATVLSNKGLVRVKAKEGTRAIINSEGNHIRAGFIINRLNYFLSADVLKFLRIKLFKGEDEVEGNLAFDNNGVSIGLIGNAGSGGLARLSIDTDQAFDRIELWYTGAVGLNLGGTLQIYYAFWDEATDNCGNPGEECMELITNASYGAEAFISTEGLLTAVDIGMDMGNIVDDDPDSYATFVQVAGAGEKREIEVTFDKIKGNQEVGFILSDVTGVASVDLIDVVQIYAYLDGTEVTEETPTGTGLNVKLIGAGDKSYVSVTPPSDINSLKLVLGSGLSVINDNLIYGVFLRPTNEDGVVDCIDDGLMTDMSSLNIDIPDICRGDIPVFTVVGGIEESQEYKIVFENKHKHDQTFQTTAIIKGDKLSFTDDEFFLTTLPAGDYWVSVDQTVYLNKVCSFGLHPTETTWEGDKSDNWNDWDNWNEGVPWDCTNVHIPNVSTYPNLTIVQNSDYDKEYWCKNIYFASGSELIGQHKLHYKELVFFDKELEQGSYYLLSAPLQNMVTGDMFVAKNASNWEDLRDDAFGNYFNPIDATTYEEQRTKPFIYQRFWSSGDDKVWNETLSRSSTRDDYDNTEDEAIECDLLTTDWSRTFNSVESMYEKGQGFAVRAGDEGATSSNPYTFHFPKSHTSYHYYNNLGTELKGSGTISRTNAGKLWIDGNTANPDLSVMLTRESSGNLFLFGNPMMSHIDIRQFLAENTNVSSVLVYDKSQKEYVTISKGTSTSSIAQIAPMEAVFLQAVTPRQSLSITLSDIMLEQGNPTATTVTAPNQLRLTATSRGRSASCVVVPSSAASDDYDAREDATLLVGSEEGSGVAVYTVAGGKALSIQRMNRLKRIPVGFYLKEEGNVTLSFDPQGDAWQGWNLVDQQTGKHYPLDSETNLGTVKSGAGRFYLERTGN